MVPARATYSVEFFRPFSLALVSVAVLSTLANDDLSDLMLSWKPLTTPRKLGLLLPLELPFSLNLLSIISSFAFIRFGCILVKLDLEDVTSEFMLLLLVFFT